jgi:hypothetical protein
MKIHYEMNNLSLHKAVISLLRQVTSNIVHHKRFIVNNFDVRTIIVVHRIIDIEVILPPLLKIFQGSCGVHIFVIRGVQVNVTNVGLNNLGSRREITMS